MFVIIQVIIFKVFNIYVKKFLLVYVSNLYHLCIFLFFIFFPPLLIVYFFLISTTNCKLIETGVCKLIIHFLYQKINNINLEKNIFCVDAAFAIFNSISKTYFVKVLY